MSIKFMSHALACASSLAFAFSAQAEEAADTSFAVGEIVVTAPAIVTSVDRLGADVAQNANVNYVWELVGRLPGVQLTNFNQGATSGKFSFRGFNGEGEINAVKLLIDGVPSNSNDGNMPYIDALFPLDITGIDVVRGTADARFGLHNIAGNAAITTRIGGTYLDAKAAIASHATYEGQLAAGLETGRFSQNYLIAYRQSAGYRAHGDLDRFSMAGKWFYRLADDLRIGAIARHYTSTAQEPGYLTLADARANPLSTNGYNATDGDRRRTRQFSLHMDAGSAERGEWNSALWFNQLRDDRYVKFSAAASQQRRVTNEDHWGVQTTLRRRAVLGRVKLLVEAGADYQAQDNVSLRYLSVARTPTSQTRNQQFDLSIGGAFVQAVIDPAEWISITPAYRLDWVGGRFTNRLAGTNAPINHYGTIRQPKLSVALRPMQGVTLYGNWGKTFQIGVGSGAYLIAPRLINLAPSINKGWEAGIKFAPSPALETRIALWQQDASGEIKRRLNDPLGDFDNLGATRRKGVDVQASARPVNGLSFWGALAWQKAFITAPDPATPALLGKAIDHVPHWMFSGGVDVTAIRNLRLSLWGGGQSSYELTTANNRGRFGDYAALNMEAAWQVLPELELSLSAKNITGGRREYVWWDGAQSLHSPAGGTDVSAAARVRF